MLFRSSWAKLRFLFRKTRFDRDLSEEIQLHLELRAEQLRGQHPLDAAAAARRRFGGPTQLREASRDVWTWRWLEDGAQDLRFAARLLKKKPGLAAIAVLTLALGIGAATSVFSIVDAVLLRPLPYKDPGRLVAIWITGTREKGLEKLFAVHADYAEFRRHARTLQSVSAATWASNTGRVLTGRGPARPVMTIPASANFFDTLGVRAALGRTFVPEDEQHGCVTVLAHSFWTTALGSDPNIVGSSLAFDQKPCTVVGVMPESFAFYPAVTQAWVLLGPGFAPDQDRMLVGIFARLQPGASIAQAQTEVRALFRAIHAGPETRDFAPVVYDLHGEFTFLAGRTLRTTLLVVFAAASLVLLIACLNVANLLLARLSERQREIAVRAALGSGQARLVRQVLTEGLLLSLMGTFLGVAFAYAAVRYFRSASPIELTIGAHVAVNLPVLLFSGALSVATTLIFALLPALRASQVDITQRLKAAGRGAIAGASRRGYARTVIAVQMALSFVLAIGATLLMGSALRMGSEPLGFNPDRLVSAVTNLPLPRYADTSRRVQFYDALLARIHGLPGVAGALTSKIPPNAGGNQTIEIWGRPAPPELARHDVGADAVSSAFFEVLGIPLRRGRTFDSRDRPDSLPVAVVNEALVREYFPDADPIGQQLRVQVSGSQHMPWLTIVGVVGNLKHTQLMNEMSWVETPILYRPLPQEPRTSVQIAVRAAAASPELGRQIQQQIAGIDATVPLHDAETAAAEISKALAYPRFRAMVMSLFALGALILSAVGLHGVLSQLVAQRMPEFGVRRAVGAQTRDLLLLVARHGGVPVAIGLACGVACTLAFSRLLSSLLYGTRPADPEVLVAVGVILLTVAVLAVAFPARRAASVDPVVALREE